MAGKRTWTDEQLREAVASSTTWAAVLRSLGLSLRGRNHVRVTRLARELALDTRHFDRLARVADDAALRSAVARSTSYEMVLEMMELPVEPVTLGRIKRRAGLLGLDTRHFARPARSPQRRRARTWSDEQLRRAVTTSFTLAGTVRALGLIPAGGNYDLVRRRIRELELETAHFRGRGWNVGLEFDPRPVTPLADVLVAGRWAASHSLKKRLFAAGLKSPRCERCGWAECAADGRVPVELDHANGDRTDNRLENLRILCPNCHALQPTHRGLNQRRRK